MRLIVAMAIVLTASASALAQDYKPNLENMITGYIQPAFQEFVSSTEKLPEAVETVCLDPNEVAGREFQKVFSETVHDFGRIQFLRFGPLLDQDRLSRLAFMPDPRGIGSRQLRKLYAQKDEDALDALGLAKKSVAVQGLTALELIAFDKSGKVRLGKPDDDAEFTCGYALAIAKNTHAIAVALDASWANPDGYTEALLTPGGSDARFKTSKEAMESVFNALVTGLIVVRDQDLLPALGTSKEKAKPRRFPFSRSGNGVTFLSSELQGIEQSISSLNLKKLTPQDFTWIFDTLNFEFGNAHKILTQLDPPLRYSFKKGDSYRLVSVLAITVKSIRDTVALELAGALDLAGGFNALDGD
ncbi:imelysin family protein [uncultured Roseibium sp.]|uniref:imelysin family protein n=1 Tax=uncultured Roseibium sp. TaxID=1936171 RepID=UPI002619F780|nr:imelysin family protein [uncultured Roseibium sp.]